MDGRGPVEIQGAERHPFGAPWTALRLSGMDAGAPSLICLESRDGGGPPPGMDAGLEAERHGCRTSAMAPRLTLHERPPRMDARHVFGSHGWLLLVGSLGFRGFRFRLFCGVLQVGF